MSREKECKCCHEWWCASDIKEDLCPNCYDCFKQLKQQLEEKDKEIERLKVFEKAYYYNQLQASQEDIQKFQNLANQSAVNINYIAIQELEKTLNFIEDVFDKALKNCSLNNGYYDQILDFIDQQIKELKGEK